MTDIESIIGIPETWIFVRIGDLAIVKGGKRLPKGATYSKEKTPFPYIRVTDFKDGSIDTNNLRYISKEVRDTISRYTISSSDIYISIAGTIGVVGTVPDELDNANLTENAAKIVIDKYTDSQYIYRLLDSPLIQQQIETQTISTTQPKLALFRIENLEIPLPPLNEQRRIVSAIEQLTDRSNRARIALADIPKLIEQFRQSVLAAAFRGDLTADWREKNSDIEPASELLERIKGKSWERVDDWQRKIPDNWVWARFSDVAEIKYNLIDPSKYLNQPHIAPNHIVSHTGELLEYDTIEKDGVTSSKHIFYAGQIIYSKIRPYLAKAVLVNFGGLCSADMYPIESKINSEFLHQ
jgi:type I restriction enzyme, S subunit